MRNSESIYQLLVNTANNDERVRAVLLTGSRANPAVAADIFQDFDVVYLVNEVASFISDAAWINRFGELMILQMPEAMLDPPPEGDGRFTYLMQFQDGNRIDLTLWPIAKFNFTKIDSLTVVLLDKDELLASIPTPSDRDYLPQAPSAQAFSDCCGEFWWVCPYVAKGLWREQIIYAKYMLDRVVREQLMKVLVWQVGADTDFSRNPGSFGKHLEQLLASEQCALLLRTYSGAASEANWDALFAMTELFRASAVRVAEEFGLDYPHDTDERVTAHLKHVRSLPKNATEMY